MMHTFFALFDSGREADSAVALLRAVGAPGERCDIVVHRGTIRDADLASTETAARAGAGLGGAVGGLLGAGTGLLLGVGAGAAVLLGAAGGVFGAIFGALGGSGAPDRGIEDMASQLREGAVLVTVRAPSLTAREVAEHLLAERGVAIHHPALL